MSRKNRSKRRNTVTVGKDLGVIEFQARFAVGRLPHLSRQTVQDKMLCLGKIGRHMENYGLSEIKEISADMIERFFLELRTEGLSDLRISNYASSMRLLCTMLGKPEIVPTNAQLGCARSGKTPSLRFHGGA